ncbi:MAG: hypothetical protein NT004_18120 [Bacteroidetes bacterium]|nr:hypothetical protein [Bacteroidota bacterium]
MKSIFHSAININLRVARSFPKFWILIINTFSDISVNSALLCPKLQVPNPKGKTSESKGMTNLESKELEFETWNLEPGTWNLELAIRMARFNPFAF